MQTLINETYSNGYGKKKEDNITNRTETDFSTYNLNVRWLDCKLEI